MKPLWKKLPIPYWASILLGAALGVILGTRFYWSFLLEGNAAAFSWERYFAAPFVNQLLWGILAPIVYFFYSKYPILNQPNRKFIVKAILASIGVSLFHEVMSYFLWWLPLWVIGYLDLNTIKFAEILFRLPAGFIGQLVEYWVLYLMFAGWHFALKYQDKELELMTTESQLNSAKLNALKLQLQPHFLFNTLNTISSLTEDQPKDAQKIISKLGNILRGILNNNQDTFIPLWQELEFVKNYLDIEQLRFNDRLSIEYDIDQEASNGLVPSFIIQPLVENAIKHGFVNSEIQGKIIIKAKHLNGELQINIIDNGVGTNMASFDGETAGIGIKNIQDRLQILYKDDFRFIIKTAPGQGLSISCNIPYKT